VSGKLVNFLSAGELEEAPMAEDSPALLEKAALILSAFEGQRSALTLTDVIRHSGLPQTTVHRLLDQLVGIGWLERDQRKYRLGLRLLELGAFALHHNRLRQAAVPHLIALHQATGHWVQLWVLDGQEVVCLDQMGDPAQSSVPFQAGGRLPAHCTATGKALLAFGGDEIEAPLAPRTSRTITSVEALRIELAGVRAEGAAFDREECFPGLSCVAAPLRSGGRALAAISLSRAAGNTDLKRLAPQVSRSARATWTSLFGTGRRVRGDTLPADTASGPENSADSMQYWLHFNEWT
jgi:DNA-binding IclR family transcriptional regulator